MSKPVHWEDLSTYQQNILLSETPFDLDFLVDNMPIGGRPEMLPLKEKVLNAVAEFHKELRRPYEIERRRRELELAKDCIQLGEAIRTFTIRTADTLDGLSSRVFHELYGAEARPVRVLMSADALEGFSRRTGYWDSDDPPCFVYHAGSRERYQRVPMVCDPALKGFEHRIEYDTSV